MPQMSPIKWTMIMINSMINLLNFMIFTNSIPKILYNKNIHKNLMIHWIWKW